VIPLPECRRRLRLLDSRRTVRRGSAVFRRKTGQFRAALNQAEGMPLAPRLEEDSMADLYCPECHQKCGVEACPTNPKGLCEQCGKPPVPWAERNTPWVWCSVHTNWHETPCAEDAKRHCCAVA
jgi:hypothetical protein